MLSPTHLFFSLAVAYLLRIPRLPAVIGGTIADLDVLLDYGFPLEHRGIVHTPFFMMVCVVFLFLAFGSSLSFSFGTGFLSHLLLDAITPAGIMLLYPLPVFFTLNLAPYSSLWANLGIILASLGAIILYIHPTFQSWVHRAFGVRLEPNGSSARAEGGD